VQGSGEWRQFTSTSINLVNRGKRLARRRSGSRAAAEAHKKRKKYRSIAARPEGRGGLSGAAFRSRQVCISNDLLVDERVSAFFMPLFVAMKQSQARHFRC